MFYRNYLVIILLSFFQVACQGDSETSALLPGGDSRDSVGGLSGKLYVDVDNKYHEVDMRTGRISALFPVTSNSEALLKPIDGGENFISVVRGRDDSSNYNSVVSIRTLSRSGDILDSHSFFGDYHSRPVVTIDSSLIALFWFPEMVSLDEEGISLFTRDGQLIWHYEDPHNYDSNNRIRAYEWMHDGTLLVSEGSEIYKLIVGNGGVEKKLLKRFEGYELYNTLKLNPEGNKLAFNMFPYPEVTGKMSQVWTMNIDGSGLKQLTNSNYGIDGAVWSPDSSMLIVRKGGIGGFDYTAKPCSGSLFLISADAEKDPIESSGSEMSSPLTVTGSSGKEYLCQVNDFPEWL